ncbi:PSD1 and planctomycete cytochrome C domain-containing protein [Zavarzinella formosa]|uniref:PSD1 and planctomycete cytochrome C domain-containing protein n=1 Tax=Zavarzinella formosa TaxID=360055 RepID=UPI000309B5C7|nr:PSD1 and planctomycete cytochrome C domain-containing protein [Zavarzinella formosa]
MTLRTRLLAAVVGLMATTTHAGEGKPLAYGRDIRPILSENCFFCHGQDPNQRKGDVRLDTAEGQKAVLKAGKPAESELVKRILSEKPGEQMPPPKSNRHLSAEQKETLRRWVAEGAKFEGHWAYQPIQRPAVPAMDGIKNPIDAFIRAKLKERNIPPAPEADRITLIRRITYDLTGLPPTPAEADAFAADQSLDAYEKLVDRLMKSPQYGERMALPWLDAARYADSNGFQQDGDTFQWVWRDWVVKALNDNKPFNEFTIEQLAGDLLPNATREQKIATAFNRNHLVNGEGGAIPEEQRFNILFDRVDVTATNWLGLTMACAQCHDHKYDPLTQKDYYSLLAAFNNVSESGTAGRQSSHKRVSPPFIDAGSPEETAKLAELEKKTANLKAKHAEAQKTWEAAVAKDEKFDKTIRDLVLNKDPKAKADRDAKLKKHFDEKIEPKKVAEIAAADKAANDYRSEELPKVMVMADDRPRESNILDRGEYLKKKEKVTTDVPAFLPPLPKDAPKNRLGLAKWLVSPENPLTARVAANRYWQTFFGQGLVKTVEDLGVQSELPEHQALLDWLAAEFRERGWDMKAMVRLIVTSATYKQSSKITPDQMKADPENKLFSRGARFRLPSMFLRDTVLAASGLLDHRVGGKPVYPYQPDGIWETLAITKERDFTYPMSKGSDLYRRSLYTFWRRTVGPANMFDASSRQACKVRPNLTNTPLHALTTLNDITWTEAARVLAEKTLKQPGDVDQRLISAFRSLLIRQPRPAELSVLKRVLEQQRDHFKKDPAAAAKVVSIGQAPRDAKLDVADHAAWSAVCLALFNLDETLTRE